MTNYVFQVHRSSARARGGTRGRTPRFPSGQVYHPKPPGSSLRSPHYAKFGMPNIEDKSNGRLRSSTTAKHNNKPPLQQIPAAAKQHSHPSFGFSKNTNQKAANHPSFGFKTNNNQTIGSRPALPHASNSPQPVFGCTPPLLPTPPPPLIANSVRTMPYASMKQLPLLPNPVPSNHLQFSIPQNTTSPQVHPSAEVCEILSFVLISEQFFLMYLCTVF